VLRGRLYKPDDARGPLPIIIMAHGFSATISGMVADRYAEVFQEAGLAVLLYDHRNFGLSGGEPRQEINKWVQARGYRDAINFVTALPEIDSNRVALWGDSMSGAEVIVVASMDDRVRAVIAQVPACGEHSAPPDPDGRCFAALRETFLRADLNIASHTTLGPLPVVSFDPVGTPCLLTPLTAFRWFIEYGGRYDTRWENRATVVNPTVPVPWHAGLCSPHLSAPVLMVIAREDEMPGSNSSIARQVFDAAASPKELLETDGGHFGLLQYPSSLFDQVSRAQADFLGRHLVYESVSMHSGRE
jgi:pimeloyl-ACP methyl ester carboxylesterase